jgi:hypothetical protein
MFYSVKWKQDNQDYLAYGAGAAKIAESCIQGTKFESPPGYELT